MWAFTSLSQSIYSAAPVGEDVLHLTVNAAVDYSLGQVSVAAFCGFLTIITHIQGSSLSLFTRHKLLPASPPQPHSTDKHVCVLGLGGAAVKGVYVSYFLLLSQVTKAVLLGCLPALYNSIKENWTNTRL